MTDMFRSVDTAFKVAIGGVGLLGVGLGFALPIAIKATVAAATAIGTFCLPAAGTVALASIPVIVTIGGAKVVRMASLSNDENALKLQLLQEDFANISPDDELEIEACSAALQGYGVEFLFCDPEPESGTGLVYSWKTKHSTTINFGIQEWGKVLSHPLRVVMFGPNVLGTERKVIPLASCLNELAASYLLAIFSALESSEEFDAESLYQQQLADKTYVSRLIGFSPAKFLETKTITYFPPKDGPIVGDGIAYSWKTMSSSLDSNFLIQEWGALMSHPPRLVMVSPHDNSVVCPLCSSSREAMQVILGILNVFEKSNDFSAVELWDNLHNCSDYFATYFTSLVSSI
jgi:hypothetical protein